MKDGGRLFFEKISAKVIFTNLKQGLGQIKSKRSLCRKHSAVKARSELTCYRYAKRSSVEIHESNG